VSTVIQFAILGMATGALYVLFALGLVIIHRGSGVVNFAHGAMGMVGTFVFWKLHVISGVPYGVALVLGVLTSGAIGLATHFLVMRPMRNSAVLNRVIATLAILTVLQEAMAKIYVGPDILVTSELPIQPVTIFGATIGRDRLYILGGSLIVAAALAVVYRSTQFGRATSAATENRRALAALGWSPDLVAAANWFIGAGLAGLAGILLAPITNLSVTGYTLLVVPALAAAVAGRLASFPLTLAGGLIIGIAQSEVGRYVDAAGWSQAVPFLAMILVLILRGPDRGLRTQVAQRLPSIGSGRINWIVMPIVVLAAIGVVDQFQNDWADAVTTTVGTGLIVLSLVVVTGYSGQLSLAQFAFAGWGAWIAGGLARSADFPFLPAIIVGGLATVPLGFVVGAVCLRTRGVNLAIATLGMAVALDSLVFSNSERTNSGSFVIPEPKIGSLDVGAIIYPQRYAIVIIVAFAVCGIAVANLRRGRAGRRLISIRSNERAAASLGIEVVQAKLAAFTFSSLIAGLGGALLAFRNPNIVFSNYNASQSIKMVGYAVVGGVGWIAGAVYGGLLEVGSLGSKVLDQLGSTVSSYLPLAGGVLLLFILLTAPDGMAPQAADQVNFVKRLVRRSPRATRLPDLTTPAGHRVRSAPLDLADVSVSFGGVKAVRSVSMTVAPGEIVGLIGPNGAGKTTLIDAATGFVRVSGGRISIDGADATRWRPALRARAGLTRSFQSLELFDDLSVLDNLRAASDRRDRKAYLTDLVFPRRDPLTPATRAAIAEFRLEPYLAKTPTELPYGVRRLVGIARAVATEAGVVALDEPAAGLDEKESRELGGLLRKLAGDWGMGILLVEHNVDLVMDVCDRVYALNFGEVIASGPPAEVRASDAVIRSYLGAPSDDAVDQLNREGV
jgi:sulfate-transporting ATPase